MSEREKFYIESAFYSNVTGDLEKARKVCELWAQTYPRDSEALCGSYASLGQYEKALAEAREALKLAPSNSQSYASLVGAHIWLNRVEDARGIAEEAQAKKLDSPALRFFLYQIAFLRNDAAGMAQQVAWSAGKPGVEDVLMAFEANTAAYLGRLGKARTLFHQAMASAERVEERETAASYEADRALVEALFGNAAEARHGAAAALKLSNGRDVEYAAALAFALAGDTAQAQLARDNLAKRFPEDTLVQVEYLPVIDAQLALVHKDSSGAIEKLQAASPYELGIQGNLGIAPAMYPVYVRGEAYLAAHQGREAAVEFQKILKQRGALWNEPIGALAHLQIGRAYAMQGDTAKAKAAYQDFLTLWKDADPDIPILIAAKAEYAKLQ